MRLSVPLSLRVCSSHSIQYHCLSSENTLIAKDEVERPEKSSGPRCNWRPVHRPTVKVQKHQNPTELKKYLYILSWMHDYIVIWTKNGTFMVR